MKAMNEAAAADPFIAERVRMFRYRVPEELYDLQADPDCLANLINQPEYQEQADRLRDELLQWMKRTSDPLRPAFENRQSPDKLKAALGDVYGQQAPKAGKRPKPR
jgi:N-sulfoglucosamine sulfohydrolase